MKGDIYVTKLLWWRVLPVLPAFTSCWRGNHQCVTAFCWSKRMWSNPYLKFRYICCHGDTVCCVSRKIPVSAEKARRRCAYLLIRDVSVMWNAILASPPKDLSCVNTPLRLHQSFSFTCWSVLKMTFSFPRLMKLPPVLDCRMGVRTSTVKKEAKNLWKAKIRQRAVKVWKILVKLRWSIF